MVQPRIILTVAVALSVVSAHVGASGWKERPRASGAYGILRQDTRLEFSMSGKYALSNPFLTALGWSSGGQLFRAGVLDRDKRNNKLSLSAFFRPVQEMSLTVSTKGWRRKDTGAQSYEQSRGASLEAALLTDFPAGLKLTQRVGLIRDLVATVGLGGIEHDNGGVKAAGDVEMTRFIAGRSIRGRINRSLEDLRLNGSDESAISVNVNGAWPELELGLFDRSKRYRTGSIEEYRGDRGTRFGLGMEMGPPGDRQISMRFSAGSASTQYREGTNQDYAARDQEVSLSLTPPIAQRWMRTNIKARLSHRTHDEVGRTIYDREEDGRSLEALMETGPPDSLYAFSLSHRVSLDRKSYTDPVNYSDHDIRDQKLVGKVSLRKRGSTWWLKMSRRANDLVYIDSQRSANTSRTNEYMGSLGYSIAKGSWRWRQSYLISARYARYRFRPEANELSRRGRVESNLSGKAGDINCEVFQKWLWDDNGPYDNIMFHRQELTEEVEAGVRLAVKSGPWRLGPGWRERWRMIYGPSGRRGGSVQPRIRESWLSLDVECPLGPKGRLSLGSTLVVRRGGSRYWQAKVKVENTW